MKLRNTILFIVVLSLSLAAVFTSLMNIDNKDNNPNESDHLEYNPIYDLLNQNNDLNHLDSNLNNNQVNSTKQDGNSNNNNNNNNKTKANNDSKNLNKPNTSSNNSNKPSNGSNNSNIQNNNYKPSNGSSDSNIQNNNYKPSNGSSDSNIQDNNNKPITPSNDLNKDNKANKLEANIFKPNIINLGSNNLGKVELIGPIGNKSSNVKIAYIIGVHPLEFFVHIVLYNSLIAKSDSLKYSYYIYKVNVTNNPNNFDKGRMNGQLLANKFVVPDAISKNYDLVVDIHSNQGMKGGNYKKTNFIFAPLNNTNSKVHADEIIAKIPPLVYYYPESQTSPSYVTIPIMKSNTPTIIYETYMYESNVITKDYINKLITTIDNLKIK